jgi:hypothetical protein
MKTQATNRRGEFFSNKDILKIRKELNGKSKLIKEQDNTIDKLVELLKESISPYKKSSTFYERVEQALKESES